ncbi:Histidine kinase-, DNA gyrase B-, and HSP90-like ATPase [compost metagenome]
MTISVVAVKKGIMVAITDNGKGITKSRCRQLTRQLSLQNAKPEGIGLFNVNQRIRLKFGPDYGLIIRSKHGEYTTVYVVWPIV